MNNHLTLDIIPLLKDNYTWVLSNSDHHSLIVDPGEAAPILHFLAQHSLKPIALLLTHYHDDHIGGVKEIIQHYPEATIYAPAEVISTRLFSTFCPEQIRTVQGGELISLNDFNIEVIATPGHTAGHITFYVEPYLFCGDLLFSAGCGRVADGAYSQMFHSIKRISSLPDSTIICCAHEYTLNNLQFAQQLLPNDPQINTYLDQVKQLRQNNHPTLPTTLEQEKKVNLFLRCRDEQLQKKLNIAQHPIDELESFELLRKLKDRS